MLCENDIDAYKNLYNKGTVDDYLLLLEAKLTPSVNQQDSQPTGQQTKR